MTNIMVIKLLSYGSMPRNIVRGIRPYADFKGI